MMFDETVPRLENVLLILVFVGSVDGQCVSTNPIAGSCFCHFIGACDWTQAPPVPFANATNALPTNIVQNFANAPNSAVTICEGILGSLAIIYDCDLRIPLYAARVLTDADILVPYFSKSDRGSFRETEYLDSLYRQKNGDYGTNAKDQIPCYEGNPPPTMYFDHVWYPDANKYGTAPQVCKPKILAAKNIKCPIHRGHLIASSYGKAAVNKRRSIRDTFILSNAVPQFGDMNSGAWKSNEQILLNWAESKCSSFNAGRRNARLFIVVGVIPSTFGIFPRRYFGWAGFADFQFSTSKNPYATMFGQTYQFKSEYRINLPAVMWTAACCEFEEFDPAANTWNQTYITKAFWGENKPFKPGVNQLQTPLSLLFQVICARTSKCPVAMPQIQIFPNQPNCV